MKGDERNFFQVKQSTQDNSHYSDTATLASGRVFDAFVYYSNDASDRLPELSAKDVRLRIQMSATATGASGSANAFISGSNTQPSEIWSSIGIVAPGAAFALRYVPGSAAIHSGGSTNGASLNADALFSNEGVLLGCDSLDGLIPPHPRCSGYVSFSFTSVQPNFTAGLELRGKQGGDFGESVAAAPGDIVEVRVTYTNTGTTEQDHVDVQAEQIAGTEIVPGTLLIYNAANPNGAYLSGDTRRILDGVDIGSYPPGSNAIVRYEATIERQGALECGGKWLIVKSRVTTSGGYKNSPEGLIDVSGVC